MLESGLRTVSAARQASSGAADGQNIADVTWAKVKNFPRQRDREKKRMRSFPLPMSWKKRKYLKKVNLQRKEQEKWSKSVLVNSFSFFSIHSSGNSDISFLSLHNIGSVLQTFASVHWLSTTKNRFHVCRS